MKRLLVCFAVKQESAPFKPPAGVSVLVTGMGAANVRSTLPMALERVKPDAVFTCGFAGALDPSLPIGFVLGETADPTLQSVLAEADVPLRRFLCADKIAITAAQKASLWKSSGCDAVEMESGIVHQICRERSIACATVRVISDTALENLPLDFNQLLNSRLQLSPWRLAGAIASNPSSIPGLIRLGRNSGTAADRLASTLNSILSPSELGLRQNQ